MGHRIRTDKADASRFRIVDLFAGCGGLSAGFRAASAYEHVGAVELDSAAAATYAANFGEENVFRGDVTDWLKSDLPTADVVVGGLPCQGFSNLGSRQARDPRNSLWRRFVSALVRIKPKVFLIENVPQFGASSQFRGLVRETYRRGQLHDYVLDAGILRATDFGAAQLRHRFIVIGTRLDLPTVRVPEPEIPQENWRTVRDAIGDLHGGHRPERIELPPRTTTFFGRPISGAYRSDELNLARRYSDLSLRRFEHVPEGGNRFSLPDELKPLCWLKKHTGAYDVLGRLAWDRPSVTIRTEFFKPEKGRYLHPVDHRALSHHEAARLQGFADDYRWCGSKIQIARQIGNAVPVPLATALARHIAASMCETR